MVILIIFIRKHIMKTLQKTELQSDVTVAL